MTSSYLGHKVLALANAHRLACVLEIRNVLRRHVKLLKGRCCKWHKQGRQHLLKCQRSSGTVMMRLPPCARAGSR